MVVVVAGRVVVVVPREANDVDVVSPLDSEHATNKRVRTTRGTRRCNLRLIGGDETDIDTQSEVFQLDSAVPETVLLAHHHGARPSIGKSRVTAHDDLSRKLNTR